jgi:hypothetical protein
MLGRVNWTREREGCETGFILGRSTARAIQAPRDDERQKYKLEPSLFESPRRVHTHIKWILALPRDIKFGFEACVHDDGVVRVRMEEVDGLRKRYEAT